MACHFMEFHKTQNELSVFFSVSFVGPLTPLMEMKLKIYDHELQMGKQRLSS